MLPDDDSRLRVMMRDVTENNDDAQDSDSDISTALDQLRMLLVEVDAFVSAATGQEIPYVADAKHRRRLDRLDCYISAAAKATATALATLDAAIKIAIKLPFPFVGHELAPTAPPAAVAIDRNAARPRASEQVARGDRCLVQSFAKQ